MRSKALGIDSLSFKKIVVSSARWLMIICSTKIFSLLNLEFLIYIAKVSAARMNGKG